MTFLYERFENKILIFKNDFDEGNYIFNQIAAKSVLYNLISCSKNELPLSSTPLHPQSVIGHQCLTI